MNDIHVCHLIHREVILTPKSNKGKTLVGRFGSVWLVVRHEMSVACCDGEGIMVSPKIETDKDVSRWLCVDNDRDFDWSIR